MTAPAVPVLTPCPCGNAAALSHGKVHGEYRVRIACAAPACSWIIERANLGGQSVDELEASAIAAWNRRAAPSRAAPAAPAERPHIYDGSRCWCGEYTPKVPHAPDHAPAPAAQQDAPADGAAVHWQPAGLCYGENTKRDDSRIHLEWHAECGCAYHPEPFPHVHPCSDKHKRPDLHSKGDQP